MKLIYRPTSLAKVNFEIEQNKLVWSKVGKSIIVKNPTPYYMNFQSINFNGKNEENITYIAPSSSKSFITNNNELHGTIKWEVINDYGSAINASEIKI